MTIKHKSYLWKYKLLADQNKSICFANTDHLVEVPLCGEFQAA